MQTGDTIEVDGDRYEIVDGFFGPALREQTPTFEEYLRENVFTMGGYAYRRSARGDIKVAEHSDGSGYVCDSDMDRAVEDDNVGLISVKDGWLLLEDKR